MIRWIKRLLVWFLMLLALLVAAITWTIVRDKMMWTLVTHEFMKDPDSSYGTGDFRVRGDQLVSLRLTEPKIKLKRVELEKPLPDGSMWDMVETESWMKDLNEVMNRGRIVVSKNKLDQNIKPIFSELAKSGGWWLSDDARVMYVATLWYDSRTPVPKVGYIPMFHKLYKSTDAGQTFEILDWPQFWNFEKSIAFRNPQEGYIIGWGPSIYRTIDGAKTWKSLHVPPSSIDPEDARANFRVVDLDEATGTLLISVYVPNHQEVTRGHSEVYRLVWGEDKPEFLFSLQGLDVVDFKLAADGVYALSAKVDQKDFFYESNAKPSVNIETAKELRLWRFGDKPDQSELLHTFPADADTGALYRLKNGTLIVDAVVRGALGSSDVLYLSRDGGKSWRKEDEGRGAQGVYFNPQTGERYRVVGHSLYKRVVN